ncbi:hypothetical protein HG530_014996 [Fusarium avenaceum]|nr:hypothetical protein HG530_014996 [Fusarium avenaceum]
MRDEAPVATLLHLIQDARLIDVYVEASPATRSLRRGRHESHGPAYLEKVSGSKLKAATSNYRPSFTFKNEETGDRLIRGFVLKRLLPFLSEDLQKLLGMIRSVPDFPRQGIEFRHVLNICQQNGGLDLCVSLIRSLCTIDLRKIDAVVGCEAGGFIFASALAISLDIRLFPIREANKLPPPKLSVVKQISHISSHTANSACHSTFGMDANALRRGASVVVIDDVLATGETLVAVLQLLTKAGVEVEDIRVMVVAEFPFHRGREKLRQAGFGRIWVQSLLCFDGE